MACKLQPVPVSSPWRNAWDVGAPLGVLRVACLNIVIEVAIINSIMLYSSYLFHALSCKMVTRHMLG